MLYVQHDENSLRGNIGAIEQAQVADGDRWHLKAERARAGVASSDRAKKVGGGIRLGLGQAEGIALRTDQLVVTGLVRNIFTTRILNHQGHDDGDSIFRRAILLCDAVNHNCAVWQDNLLTIGASTRDGCRRGNH